MLSTQCSKHAAKLKRIISPAFRLRTLTYSATIDPFLLVQHSETQCGTNNMLFQYILYITFMKFYIYRGNVSDEKSLSTCIFK